MKVIVMSKKLKASLFALLLTPAIASATDADHDVLTHEIFGLTPVMVEGDTMMADINRKLDTQPTAAGQVQPMLFDYYGVSLDETF